MIRAALVLLVITYVLRRREPSPWAESCPIPRETIARLFGVPSGVLNDQEWTSDALNVPWGEC